MRSLPGPLLGLALAACTTFHTVPLLTAAGIPTTVTPTDAVQLEVITRGTGVLDPLPVAGSFAAYAEVEAALGHAVASATVPWAATHAGAPPGGYQLAVELTKAEARYGRGRTRVTLAVRATLRARRDRQYLGQTQAVCSEAAIAPADEAAPVLFACMNRLGRDLTAWLGLIQPAGEAAAR